MVDTSVKYEANSYAELEGDQVQWGFKEQQKEDRFGTSILDKCPE